MIPSIATLETRNPRGSLLNSRLTRSFLLDPAFECYYRRHIGFRETRETRRQSTFSSSSQFFSVRCFTPGAANSSGTKNSMEFAKRSNWNAKKTRKSDGVDPANHIFKILFHKCLNVLQAAVAVALIVWAHRGRIPHQDGLGCLPLASISSPSPFDSGFSEVQSSKYRSAEEMVQKFERESATQSNDGVRKTRKPKFSTEEETSQSFEERSTAVEDGLRKEIGRILEEREAMMAENEKSPQPQSPRIPIVPEDSVRLERMQIPSSIDPIHQKTIQTLQHLDIIRRDLNPQGICTRREFARWMVYASTVLARSISDRVFPAVYVEGLTELAFDDVFPDDADFPFIQGLAEAGLIPSRLSRADTGAPYSPTENWFHPDSPLTRQDMLLWKTNLDIKALPKISGEVVRRVSTFIDVEKIDKEALPSIAYDLSTGEDSIITTAFGYTRRFEPLKAVSHAQAAYALACGNFAVKVVEEMERRESEEIAEEVEAKNAAQEAALQTMVQEQVSAERKMRLEAERRLAEALEKIERARIAREEEHADLKTSKEAICEEREILQNLRTQTESNLASLSKAREEVEAESRRLAELRGAAEGQSLALEEAKIQAEVERQSLAIAKAWAEEEANRAREESKQLRALRRRIKSRQIEATTRLTPGVTTEESVIFQEEKEAASPTSESQTALASSAVALTFGDALSDFVRSVEVVFAAIGRMLTTIAIWMASGIALNKRRLISLCRKEMVRVKTALQW